MPSLDQAQLSALGDGVDDLAQRAARLADQLDRSETSDVANALYEAERSLRMAERAVDRARRAIRS